MADDPRQIATNTINPSVLAQQVYGVDEGGKLISSGLNIFQSYLVQTYKYNNAYNFFQLYPPQWKTFAYQTIFEWISWSNGNSQRVHQSTKLIPSFLAPTLIEAITDLIMGGGVQFDVTNINVEEEDVVEAEEDKTAVDSQFENDKAKILEFFEVAWGKDTKLLAKIYEVIRFTLEGGTALLRASIDSDGDLWLDSSRIDRFLPNFDAKGNLTAFKLYTDVLAVTFQRGSQEATNWTLVEQRYFKDTFDGEKKVKKPVVKYIIERETGLINSKHFSYNSNGVNWNSLPSTVRDAFSSAYGTTRINEEIELPGDSLLGVVVKRTENSSVIPDIPLGDSILVNAITDLLFFDLINTKKINDVYIGSGKVYLPSNSSPANFMGDGLDRSVEKAVGFGGNANGGGATKPEAVQFDLRATQWAVMEEGAYTKLSLAFKIGMGYLVPHLTKSVQKTTKEISAEENMTTSTVENIRTVAGRGINEMLDMVMKFYGWYDKGFRVKIKFSKAGLTNTTTRIELNLKQYEAGAQSLFTTIQNINPDWTEEQVSEEIKRLDEERQKAIESQPEMLENGDGEFVKDNMLVSVKGMGKETIDEYYKKGSESKNAESQPAKQPAGKAEQKDVGDSATNKVTSK